MALLDDNSEARTERPTERRRRQARERGLIAHSVELLIAARLLATWMALVWWFAAFATSASSSLRRTLEHAGSNALPPSNALMPLRDLAWQFVANASWPLLAVTVALLMTHFAQVGWLWRWENATPQPSRLSPIAGLQRLFSLATIGRALKLALKLAIATSTLGFVLSPYILFSSASMASDFTDHLTAFSSTAVRLVAQVSIALLTYAALDYAWQRWCFERSLQMTHEEIRAELKELEGNSHLKSHRQTVAQSTPMTSRPPDSNTDNSSNADTSA